MTDSELQPLPLGTSSFSSLRQFNQIYVDKTRLVYELARKPEKFFLARPRRFGKSLLISTFESLFKHGLRDFKGLAIEKLWKDETQYKVVRLDFSEIKNFSNIETFNTKLQEFLADGFRDAGFPCDLRSPVPDVPELSGWLQTLEGNSLVLLIDEYDAPLTACLNKPELFEQVQMKLSEFYSIIKANDGPIRFLFMTGITKLSGPIFETINNLSDISLSQVFGTLLGFTTEEVEQYFGGYLTKASDELGIGRDDLMEKLQKYYNGYCFEGTAKLHVFDPWSLLKFLSLPEDGLVDYWVESGGRIGGLLEYMRSNYLRNPEEFGAKKSIARHVLCNAWDLDDLGDIGFLTQTGYLTIKSVKYGDTIYVDYPNMEVGKSMAHHYLDLLLKGQTAGLVGACNIDKILASESAETVVHTFNRLFENIDYQQYPITGESLIRAILQVYMAGNGLSPKAEFSDDESRSDLEVTSGNRHWVFELKVAGKGDSVVAKLTDAVDQITSRRYGNPDIGYELKRMALVFSLEEREFVKWAELPPDQ